MSRTPRLSSQVLLAVACLLVGIRAVAADDLRVMTSGTFTAALLQVVPQLEPVINGKVVLVTTTMGVGANSIPSRLGRGEAADIVIVADDALVQLIQDGRVLADSRVPLARSSVGMAVRAGAPKPDISTVEAFTRALLRAKTVAYSASVSGRYLSTELFHRLGIAEEMRGKSRMIEGERVGAVVARGEAEVGFQQISELLPVPGITLVGPLPAEIQLTSTFSAGVAAHSTHPDAARAAIRFLASPGAAASVAATGLEPVTAR